MDRRTVLAAAGAMVLTVVGGISALAVAFGGAPVDSGSSPSLDATDTTVVVTEYVDQYGNPVAAPGTALTTDAGFTYTPTPQFEDPSPSRGTLPPADTPAVSALGGGTSASVDASYGGSDDQYEGSDDEYEGSDDEYEGSEDHSESHDQSSDDEHEDGDD